MSLRSGLTRPAFERYESIIKRALDNYPNSVLVRAEGLTLNTLIARLRDALKSLRDFKWIECNEEQLATLEVTNGPDNQAILGPRLTKKQKAIGLTVVEGLSKSPLLPITLVTAADRGAIEGYARLASFRPANLPQLSIPKDDPEVVVFLARLEDNYDVSFIETETHYILI
jgi:hypothetical protein